MSKTWEFRRLGSDDWGMWRTLRLDALAEAPYAFCSTLAEWQENDREDRWRERLSLRGSLNLVALLDGDPVGMVSGVPTSDQETVELISMWVAPSVRGRGVGSELVRRVEDWAVEEVGAQAVRLAVSDANDAASQLYQRHGFDFTGEYGDDLPHGEGRERLMEKRLPSAPQQLDT